MARGTALVVRTATVHASFALLLLGCATHSLSARRSTPMKRKRRAALAATQLLDQGDYEVAFE
jgi:hypothetical protein